MLRVATRLCKTLSNGRFKTRGGRQAVGRDVIWLEKEFERLEGGFEGYQREVQVYGDLLASYAADFEELRGRVAGLMAL